ncbi:hypothetical protein D3C81_2327440 [compost metagenome]
MSTTPTSGTKLLSAPVETITASTVPNCRPSINSRSQPRADEGNCLNLKALLVAFSVESAQAWAAAP